MHNLSKNVHSKRQNGLLCEVFLSEDLTIHENN